MYTKIERNEIGRRRSALFLAVALHLGLVAFLYLKAIEKPEPPRPAYVPVKTTPHQSSPQPKAVNLP